MGNKFSTGATPAGRGKEQGPLVSSSSSVPNAVRAPLRPLSPNVEHNKNIPVPTINEVSPHVRTTIPEVDLPPASPTATISLHEEPMNHVDLTIKRQEASRILQENYPPEVAAQITDAFEPFVEFSDAEFKNRCDDTTDAVHATTGFPTIYGFFTLDRRTVKEEGNVLAPPHAWSEDPEGRILDLSAQQFNPYLDEPITDPVLVVDQNHPLRSRYRPLDTSESPEKEPKITTSPDIKLRSTREDPPLPSPEQLRNPWESEAAWTQVYKTLEPQLKRQALQLTKGNVHDAEDLVQTALQKLYSQINKGTEITNIAGYARSTLHHAGIDHIRDRLRTPPSSSLDMPVVAPSGEEEPLIEQLPSIQNVEAEALEPLIAKDLISLLRTTKMSDDQLGTLLLHAAGLSPKEIAELRNTPDATIRGRLARARATAAEALTPYVPPDEITRRRLKWVTPEQS